MEREIKVQVQESVRIAGWGPQQSAQQAVLPAYSAGWYIDPNTGALLYYDPAQGKFFTPQGGVYYPLYASGQWPPIAAPKTIAIAPGDHLKVTLSFKYIGPAVTGVTGYYAIGVYGGGGFGETMYGTTSFNIPANLTATPITVTNYYTFTIPTNVDTNWKDIYVKMYGGSPSVGSSLLPNYIFGYTGALTIVGNEPTITDFQILDFAKV